MIFAIKKFHKMIYGRKLTLITDHKTLFNIYVSKEGIPVFTTNQLQIVSEFTADVRTLSVTS